jgi:uncharacterized membrane protein YkoI
MKSEWNGVFRLVLPMIDRRVCLLAGLSLLLIRFANADPDHEQARIALRRGEIRSLSDIMQEVRPQLGGEIIEVSFKAKKRGRNHAYEFKVLLPNGRVSEVLVDAATAKILKREIDD